MSRTCECGCGTEIGDDSRFAPGDDSKLFWREVRELQEMRGDTRPITLFALDIIRGARFFAVLASGRDA